MTRRLLLLSISALCSSSAFAGIERLSTSSEQVGPIAVLGATVCVEGYVVYLPIEGSAIQILSKDGKPLRCKGEKHPAVID